LIGTTATGFTGWFDETTVLRVRFRGRLLLTLGRGFEALFALLEPNFWQAKSSGEQNALTSAENKKAVPINTARLNRIVMQRPPGIELQYSFYLRKHVRTIGLPSGEIFGRDESFQ
jgi:hypothetical protein